MQIRPVVPGLALLILLLAASSFSPAGPGRASRPDPPHRLHPPPTQEERRRIREQENGPRQEEIARALQAALVAPGSAVDVQRYSIDLKVIPAPAKRIEGAVRIQASVLTGGLAVLDVGLYDVLAVTSIVRGATSLAYTRGNNLLHITLDRSYAAGEMVDLVITYAGTPPVLGYGSFTFRTHDNGTQPIISSLSEPSYAPTWWPCIDHPADKAIVEMNLNVPANLVGVSNGLLAGTVDLPDGTRTYQWRSAYPISTYLVSVAISNYSTWTDTYDPVTGGAPMPVQHWVYPEHLTAARADLAVTVPQLRFFSELFGEYPFASEKYGHAITSFGGGMEHQTATSFGASLIRGDGAYYWIVAHELAHQWWGDSVTLADFREIWLNEGFATYSEALWYENLSGVSGLRTYMTSLDSRPFCGTVYDPVAGSCSLFGKTVYDKGGWVLHMLRRVIGDASFFQGLRNYHSDFGLANAATSDLRATMEAASGQALGNFFNRWVYQTGEPSYAWGWTAAQTPAGWVTYVRIQQAQPSAPFIMPIDLRVSTASGSFTTTVQNTSVVQDFTLPPVPDQPTGVSLDPDLWILKSTTPVTLPDGDADGVPDTSDNCPAAANPAQDDLDSDRSGDACDPDIDGDGRENTADCAPADPAAQDLPGETTGLEVSGGSPITLVWDADPAQGAGLTFELLRGDAAALAPDAGVARAACIAVGLSQPSASDPETPPLDGSYYYLVRKRNICGPGTLGTSSAGLPRQSPGCP